MKKIVKAYLHSSKDTMYELGEEIGLKGKALEKFTYALYEVELKLEVESRTGKYKIIEAVG